jgi:uncharacterized protein YigE (DUF2233 family)
MLFLKSISNNAKRASGPSRGKFQFFFPWPFVILSAVMKPPRLALASLLQTILVFSAAQVGSQAPGRLIAGGTLSVRSAGQWRTLQKGVALRTIALERAEPSYTLEFKLVRFDTQQIAPRVLHAGQWQLKGADARTFAEKSGALAAINASYFDEKGRPLAYLKTVAQEINRAVSKHSLYTGIFGVGDAGPFVTHRDEFQPAEAKEALQCGPLLLHRGTPVEISSGLGRYARRAVIGIDKQGQMIVAVTDAVMGGLSFAELQELFSNPKWQLEAPELLNLDGGGSAQLYVKSGKFEDWVPGTTEVPVSVAFFVKSK